VEWHITIARGEIEQPFSVIGTVRVTAYPYGKTRPGADDPIMIDDANFKLREDAARQGANAVIRVDYEPKHRWYGSVRALEASGIAVVFTCVRADQSGIYSGDRCLDCSGVVAD
jgi:hypothetical protein